MISEFPWALANWNKTEVRGALGLSKFALYTNTLEVSFAGDCKRRRMAADLASSGLRSGTCKKRGKRFFPFSGNIIEFRALTLRQRE